MNATERRLRLTRAGFTPVPLHGKRPSLQSWQTLVGVTAEQIEMWAKTWPDARNTGALTRLMPVLDADITNEAAAIAIEELVRDRYEDAGVLMVRIGKPPKRAFLFRTIEPFDKIAVNLTDRTGNEGEKLEFLADGQQLVLFGIHPETGQPYRWHGGEPGKIKLEDLPYIREAEAQALVDAVVELLIRDYGYNRAPTRRKRRKGNSAAQAAAEPGAAEADWKYLLDNIHVGRELHASLRDLAAKLIAAGMSAGAVVNQLRALMNSSSAPKDDRWKDRYADIPRLVETAEELRGNGHDQSGEALGKDFTDGKNKGGLESPTTACTVDDTLKKHKRWLLLKDDTPVLAVLGTVAANYLDGDPVWLGVIAPPSSAKTELLNSTSRLAHVVQAASLTPAGLLSGTPKRQQAKGAKGGLLQQIGDLGILVVKDFGTILSMHPETKAETLAALREVYDGAWTRHVGSDGGRTLHWRGKVGLVFASTEVIDSHYSVIGAMGDRFLFTRLAPTPGKAQFDRALDHVGATTKQMREELAQAVAQLFAGRKEEPRPISKEEAERIGAVISLVVRLRGPVERDRRTREIEAIYNAEGTARIGLALERLLAGLDTLGVERERAMQVVLAVAMDSVPPLRRAAYDYVCDHHDVETADVAIALRLPTNTARRILEDLAAHGLIARQSQGKGNPDLWNRADWEAEQ
jgi:Bifunctional DNA primase/polymerase, N-terminal/FaeA-like protein